MKQRIVPTVEKEVLSELSMEDHEKLPEPTPGRTFHETNKIIDYYDSITFCLIDGEYLPLNFNVRDRCQWIVPEEMDHISSQNGRRPTILADFQGMEDVGKKELSVSLYWKPDGGKTDEGYELGLRQTDTEFLYNVILKRDEDGNVPNVRIPNLTFGWYYVGEDERGCGGIWFDEM